MAYGVLVWAPLTFTILTLLTRATHGAWRAVTTARAVGPIAASSFVGFATYVTRQLRARP